MPTPKRGGPDENAPGWATAESNVDVGLAVEFGSLGFSRIDAHGRVFLADVFNGGLAGWNVSGSGAGNQAFITGLQSYAAEQCAVLDPGSSGAGHSQINKSFPILPSQQLGLEAALMFAGSPNSPVSFSLQIGDNFPSNHEAELKFLLGTGWQIWIGGNTYQTILADTTIPAFGTWYIAKMAADFAAGKWIRALITNALGVPTVIDLSGYTIGTGSHTPPILVHLDNFGNAASQYARVGYVVMSVDEG